jgi:copper chaperone
MEILKYKIGDSSTETEQKIASLLNHESIVHKWHLETNNGETILTLSGNQVDPQQIINLLKQHGIQADFLQVFGAGGSGL